MLGSACTKVKMSPKRIRKAVEDLIKEYLPANIESNTGFLQNTLLTALQKNADETRNKFHIRLEDNKNVNIDDFDNSLETALHIAARK